MGPTEFLPYARRRSSIHLDPLGLQGDSDNSSAIKINRRASSTSDGESPTGSPNSVHLAPVRAPFKKNIPEKFDSRKRTTSCENIHIPRQQRSCSVHSDTTKTLFRDRPRRNRRISIDDDFETTAQFIENIRRELIKQL